MMRSSLAMLMVLVLTVMVAPTSPRCLAAAEEVNMGAIVTGNNTFALNLYAQVRGEEGNLFLSPFSISTALAMTYAGARGETATQMREALHLGAEGERLHQAFGHLLETLNAQGEKGGYQLSVANALWGQKGAGFLREFLDLTQEHYGAGLREVDFARATEAARRTINTWVEKETKDKIKDLIQPGVLSALTELVLINAIYFKGTWADPFDEKSTRDASFTLGAGDQVKVPTMHRTDDFRYAEGEGFQALELPYEGNDLSMVIVLPREADGLAALEARLSAENLESWLAGLRRRKVRVALPRFTMTSSFRLEEALKSLGMTDAFSGRADFSGMNGTGGLFISAVIHKAFVDVNEEGTEAAAATAVVMMKSAAPRRPVVFQADPPFLFLIRDNRSGSILFIGRLANPKA